MAATFEKVNPDVVVIVGNDQQEVFCDKNMPAFSIYWGASGPYHAAATEARAVRPRGAAGAWEAGGCPRPASLHVPALGLDPEVRGERESRARSASTSSAPSTSSMIVEIFSTSVECVFTRISSTAWAARYVSVCTR